MADTCIVCLSDLRQQETQNDNHSATATSDDVPAAKKRSLRDTRLTSKSVDDDDEIIAHLLPCKHNLHNACLKPWVERANSCPICRATFNTVELSTCVGGEVIDTYAVQDKVQEVVFDQSTLVNDDDFPALRDDLDWDAVAPCIICDMIDESHEVMYCDGCDGTVHVFCAGYSDSPEIWYCSDCVTALDLQSRRPPGATTAQRVRRGRRNDAIWANIWQEVSRRLDLDLDFPFSDDADDARTNEQRREFGRWQRRFQVADRQGSARRLRRIAARLHQPPAPIAPPVVESQEVIRAWNAFEKARESQGEPSSTRRKRLRSDSPETAPETTEQPQLKRPRLRRPLTNTTPQAESSAAAAQRATTADHPTFLSSLLREVEQAPVSAASPGASEMNGHQSPRNSSPARSPSSSGLGTPRAVSPMPQPPTSPPLCSTIMPPLSPPGFTFSPFSPALPNNTNSERHQRGRARVRPSGELQRGFSDPDVPSSPVVPAVRHLSLASKEEIQRMVKLVLRPRYKEKQLTKDEYTDINRDVSRKMYELVGDATALSDEAERARWQDIAEKEVLKAVSLLGSHRQEAEASAS